MAKPKAKGISRRELSDAAAAKAPAPPLPATKSTRSKLAPAKRSPFKRASARTAVILQQGDRLDRLWNAIQEVREGRRESPRTARLLASGAPKLAQKLVEEAAETAIEAVRGQREALINESVDLLYNLTALWNGLGVAPSAIWAEMDRREATLGMAEKLPKTDDV